MSRRPEIWKRETQMPILKGGIARLFGKLTVIQFSLRERDYFNGTPCTTWLAYCNYYNRNT